MTHRSYKPSKPYAGPPPVVSVADRKTASLCEMNRAGKRLQTRHRNLAKAESTLARVSALAAKDRHPDAIENLKARVENAKQWLSYSVSTLGSIVQFAVARLNNDPMIGHNRKNLHRRKTEHHRQRGTTNRRYHDQIRHWARVVEHYQWAIEATAGHSQSSQALLRLKKLCQPSIRKYVKESPREASDAEQMALLGILRAAESYDPSHKRMAQFNSFAQHWIRRKTQARRGSACAPGKTILKGKIRTTKSIEAERKNANGDVASSDLFHPSTMGEDAGLAMDISAAMSDLDDLSRAIVNERLIKGRTLKDIASEKGLSKSQVDRLFKKARSELQRKLAAHAPEG